VSYDIVPFLRRGRLLTPSQFGCLSGIPTLNVTRGCLFQCTYCYARGYPEAPRKGTVHLYANLPELLEEELRTKRKVPQWVVLNTSSDCFQTHPDILALSYEVIRILLHHGIGISLLTKGVIPQRFVDLFKERTGAVFAQIGIVSLSERYWRSYEPGAPQPEERLETIRRLKAAGLSPEVRIDPVIPFVTDMEGHLSSLFEKLKKTGIARVSLSYLHVRPAIHQQLMTELSVLDRRLIDLCFGVRDWKEIGASTRTKLLPRSVREKGYGRIKKIAERSGIEAAICRCKNPDMEGDLCSAGRVSRAMPERPRQLPLFRC
jgi:DNA repair photolyase